MPTMEDVLCSPLLWKPMARLPKSSRRRAWVTKRYGGQTQMNIRQLLLDVDKAVVRPSLLEIAAAIDECNGVEAINITVEEIDIETVGMNVTIEGDSMDYKEITKAIESTGAVVHSLDHIAIGQRIIPHIVRIR
jgi:uncharacterized protein